MDLRDYTEYIAKNTYCASMEEISQRPHPFSVCIETMFSDMPFREDLSDAFCLYVAAQALNLTGIKAQIMCRPVRFWEPQKGRRELRRVHALEIEGSIVPISHQAEWKGWVMRAFGGAVPRQAEFVAGAVDVSEATKSAVKMMLRVNDVNQKIQDAIEWYARECVAARLLHEAAGAPTKSLPRSRL